MALAGACVMATPLTPAELLAAFKAEDLPVHEHTGWKTHERDDETGKIFGPVVGVLIHHTAGHNDKELCYNGRSDLPGPLCHAWLGKTSGLWLLSAGRANHAGGVDGDVIAALRAEASQLPVDNETDVDGNDCLYGLEIENLGNGRDPYPPDQYRKAVLWAAALCRAHGWSERSVAGHKEVQPGKIDPSFDMNLFRADVKAQLASSEEEDVALTVAEKTEIAALSAKEVWEYLVLKGEGPAKWSAAAQIRAPHTALGRIEPKIDALTAVNDKLVTAVATLAANIGDLDPATIVAELKAAIESVTITLDADGA